MTRDLEVQVADSEAQGATVRIVHDYVPDEHVAMALVRAANAACVQLGIEPPGALFTQADTEKPALLETISALTEQSAMITQALADAGFPGRASTGSMLTAIADLRKQVRVGRALGDGFSEALADARDAYDRAALTGRELNAREQADDTRPIEPERAEIFREAANALGHLLAEMRGINPRPERKGDGTTTVTLTEPVEIGTPATAPEATP